MTDYFLIQRNYRSLGKVAWLIIAAAKASAPPPLSMNGVYRNQGYFFFCSLPFLLVYRQWI